MTRSEAIRQVIGELVISMHAKTGYPATEIRTMLEDAVERAKVPNWDGSIQIVCREHEQQFLQAFRRQMVSMIRDAIGNDVVGDIG